MSGYKRLPFEYDDRIYPKNNCIHCEKPLKLGEFAYDQTMCWDCFEKRVQGIAKNAQTPEDAAMVIHLLVIAKEIFRRRSI